MACCLLQKSRVTGLIILHRPSAERSFWKKATLNLKQNFEIFSKICPEIQARKRNPNPNFLVRIFSGGVGVFHMKGWGPKSSVCPSKPRETKLLGGISRGYCWDIPGVPEKFEKKGLCSILVSHASWQVEKASPHISPDFLHRRFQISNRISNQIPPEISQHASAGLAVLIIMSEKAWCP